MKNKKYALTLLEILVICLVIVLIALILFPVIVRYNFFRGRNRRTSCTSNQRQIAASLLMYAQDNEENLPESSSIWSAIRVDPAFLFCPIAGKKLPNGFVYNNKLSGISCGEIAAPDKTFMTADGKTVPDGTNQYDNIYYSPADIQYRHSNFAVASYADGHVADVFPNAANLPWVMPVKMEVVKPIPVKKTIIKKKSGKKK